ncbi:MAG: hypothetical protein BWX98_01619 [Candidatus Aminicenantes bacterium ADurb.Bin147]|nr:MAG: hypothetical protein BWX98_01619 [Candidatus Aminicenantes bacterium ADurb.Bin147]
MTIRGNVRRTQELEISAAEKAGLRVLLLDEERLLGKDGDIYVRELVAAILDDIAPELKESAALGVRLAKLVKGVGQ